MDESPSAQTESTTYINDKSATKYVKGYETTFPFDTDLISDEAAVTFIYDIARNQKVGEDAETEYIRVELFNPVEESRTLIRRGSSRFPSRCLTSREKAPTS